ncbi:hypothetical protein M1271_00845 [Patescibacteria group bacterium]|nr:hypothetical protein [Patescibacteria group bacterium]MCL5797565.1 hypothetical protein [Patescibacteria group bacterium]
MAKSYEREARRAQRTIDLELNRPHHDFLDLMGSQFDSVNFVSFLEATKKHYPDSPFTPTGDLSALEDKDVLTKVNEIVDKASSIRKLSIQEKKDIRTAAYFAIWAHGADTRFESKRFRHELKTDGSGKHQPYAMHLARVAERLVGFDTTTIQVAFLHDIIENTRYTYEDLKEIFGIHIANACRKTSKISTDSIEEMSKDLSLTEVGVATDFLRQFRLDEEIEKLIALLDKELGTSSHYKSSSVSEFEKLPYIAEKFESSDVITLSEALNKYVTGEEEAQILTFMRLLSVLEKESEVRALIVKCADVADNMTTIGGLVAGRGQKRAEEKALLARNVYAPIARILGLDEMALQIEDPAFLVLDKASGKFKRFLSREKFSVGMEGDISEKLTQFRAEFFASLRGTSPDIRLTKDENTAVRFALRYPNASELNRFRMDRGIQLAPFVDIFIRDRNLHRAFIKFLEERGALSEQNISTGKVTSLVGERVKKTDFRLRVRGHNKSLATFIYDSSGDIVDIFRRGTPEWQRQNAQERYSAIKTHLSSGDYSDFLDQLQTGKVMKVSIVGSSGYSVPSNLYLAEGATAEDALVMSGRFLSRPVVLRNGRIVEDMVLQPGDVIELHERVYGDSSLVLDPEVFDRLATKAARNRVKTEMMQIMESQYRNEDKEKIRRKAIKRGIKIMTGLADAKRHRTKNYYYSSNPQIDKFYQSLLVYHRHLVNRVLNNEFLLGIGMTQLPFSHDGKFISDNVYNEWRGVGEVENRLNRLIDWVKENCWEVLPKGNEWVAEAQSANSAESIIIFGEFLNQLKLKTEYVLQEIVFIPALEGQIVQGGPFFVTVDRWNLERYAKERMISEEEAMNRLFGRANRIIKNYR